MGAAGVDGEQASKSDVTRDLYRMRVEVLVGSADLDLLSTNPEPERKHEVGPQGPNPKRNVTVMEVGKRHGGGA